mmetsp:Transcript_16896/g.39493  ORF Transcript_16896/g.39493 Transcript_16896/m.39493 type:complete len:242 (-) Transcript_16896:173-898(-)
MTQAPFCLALCHLSLFCLTCSAFCMATSRALFFSWIVTSALLASTALRVISLSLSSSASRRFLFSSSTMASILARSLCRCSICSGVRPAAAPLPSLSSASALRFFSFLCTSLSSLAISSASFRRRASTESFGSKLEPGSSPSATASAAAACIASASAVCIALSIPSSALSAANSSALWAALSLVASSSAPSQAFFSEMSFWSFKSSSALNDLAAALLSTSSSVRASSCTFWSELGVIASRR